jgi:hypothetical protein
VGSAVPIEEPEKWYSFLVCSQLNNLHLSPFAYLLMLVRPVRRSQQVKQVIGNALKTRMKA